MQHTKSDQAHAKAGGRRHRTFTGAVAVVGTVGLAAAVLLPAGPALAAYQQAPSDTPISITVTSSITLSGLTTPHDFGTFASGETPGAVLGAVTMDVSTNNGTGYNVTVAPATALWTTGDEGIGDPVTGFSTTNLSVEDADTGNTILGYQPLGAPAPATPVTVYNRDDPSNGVGGGTDGADHLSNNYEFNTAIPNVPGGAYSVGLDYVATSNLNQT